MYFETWGVMIFTKNLFNPHILLNTTYHMYNYLSFVSNFLLLIYVLINQLVNISHSLLMLNALISFHLLSHHSCKDVPHIISILYKRLNK